MIEIHLRDASIHDYSGLNAINTIAEKYRNCGKSIELKHMNVKSLKLVTKAAHLINENISYITEIIELKDKGDIVFSKPEHLHVTEYAPNV